MISYCSYSYSWLHEKPSLTFRICRSDEYERAEFSIARHFYCRGRMQSVGNRPPATFASGQTASRRSGCKCFAIPYKRMIFSLMDKRVIVYCIDMVFRVASDSRRRAQRDSGWRKRRKSICRCQRWAMWSARWSTPSRRTFPTAIPSSLVCCRTRWAAIQKLSWFVCYHYSPYQPVSFLLIQFKYSNFLVRQHRSGFVQLRWNN